MFRISIRVCSFVVLASFVLPMAAQQPLAPPVTGTGTANHITKWITTTKLGNSGIFENASGDVGIEPQALSHRSTLTARAISATPSPCFLRRRIRC